MAENNIINTLETDINIAERLRRSSADVRVAVLKNVLNLLYLQKAEIQKLKLKLEVGIQKEVQRGFWIFVSEPNGKLYCYDCPVCANSFPYVGITTAYKYCPNCGAKMDLTLKTWR